MALRTPLTAQPHLYIGDSTGRPLDYGRVYFGEPNKDPEFYPIDIYLDPEMTIAAAQPVRTKGGFMDVGGNLAELHAAEVIYSLKVLDQYGRQVFYKPEMYRNNVSDFLVDEITRATAAENLIAGNLTTETQRAIAAEEVIATAVVTEKDRAIAAEAALDSKYESLNTTIGSIGGGKKAYTTYAKMVAAAALPEGDPLKLPANSSVDVTNDDDATKNATYAYDGTTFTKSAYDLETLVRNKVINSFSTLAKMQMDGAILDNGTLAQVYNETANNGLYVKTAGAWVKSSYDVKSIAQEVADSVTTEALSNYFTEPDNLFSFENITRNKVIGVDGSESDTTNFGITDYIPVEGNSEYTLKTTVKYATTDIAFYDREKNFIKRDTLTDSETKTEYVFSITIPSGVSYVRFNLNAVSYTKNKIAFYMGELANLSGYPLYHKPELASNISLSPELLGDIRYGVMPYDFVGKHVEPPKNIINSKLFTVSGVVSASGEITPLEGYAHTQPIRVKGDTEYVLQTQGNRYALRYIAWYTVDDKFISRDVAYPSDIGVNHVVLRSPVLARYCVVISETKYLDSIINNVAMYIGSAIDPNFSITDTSAKLIDVTTDSSHGSNESLELNPDIIKLKTSLVSGYNLFNPATAEASTVISATGELTPNHTYFASDYIPVSEGVYTILGTRATPAPFTHINYYTKDKVFIRRVDINYANNGSEGSNKLLIAIPSGVALVRLNGNLGTAYERNRMFIKGDVSEDTAYDTGETSLTKVKLAQDVRFDARTPRFRTDTDISGTFHTNIIAHEAEKPYTTDLNSAQVYERYDALAALHPESVQTFELGVDALGNRMAYYKFTSPQVDVDMGQKMPVVFINCGIHGGERIGPTVIYRLMEQLLTNWRSSDALQSLRFNVTYLVLPVSNPSGWNIRERYNHNGVDINRNFPTGWGVEVTASGSAPFSEPESRAVAKVIDDNASIDVFWDYHNFTGSDEKGYYTWMPITERCYPYMRPMAMSYLSKLTHLLQRDYDYIPDDWVAGWVDISREVGMAQDYAAAKGVPFSSTFELCSYLYPYAEHLGVLPGTVAHDEVHSKTMYEATVNAIIMFLIELQRY